MPRSPIFARVLLLFILALAISDAAALASQGELVLVKEAGPGESAQYHRPDCPVVRDGKGVLAMTRAQAESRGSKPHRECDPATSPPAKPAGAASSPSPSSGPPPAAELVVVDAGGRYYHRVSCTKIGSEPHKVALTEAGKRWPCPACRPPIRKRADAPLVPNWRGD